MKKRLKIFHFAGLIFFALFISCNDGDTKKKSTPIKNTTIDTMLDSLQATVQQYPAIPAYRQQLIHYLIKIKEYKKALQQNDSLKNIAGDVPVIHFNKALVYDATMDTVNAIQSLEKALLLNPYYTDATFLLATLLSETKNARCISFIDSCFQLQRADKIELDLLLLKGNYYANINNYKKAMEIYNQCIVDDYTFMDAYQEKGYILYKQKMYKESLQVFEKAITINNKYADGYFWIGRNNEALKDTLEAINNYKRAIFFDNTFQEAKDRLKKLGGSL